MTQKQKVLIVKLGFDETIGSSSNLASYTVSLGDVFRTTSILHIFKDDDVTWLTTKESLPLLKNNPYINRLLIYDLSTVLQLKSEHFDIVINLEKIPGVCALTDSIIAWKRYGFRFDSKTGTAEAYEGAFDALATSSDLKLRKKITKPYISLLYEMLGLKWKGESYILGYKPKTKETYDMGFNMHVGKKWPTKAWDLKNWKKLEKLIGDKWTISHQQALNNIHDYIDWLNSCRLIITNDSLGLHLAIALKKKIIALFGPTSEKEVHLFDLGKAIVPEGRFDCAPCFLKKCKFDKNCINTVKPQTIYKHIESLLEK